MPIARGGFIASESSQWMYATLYTWADCEPSTGILLVSAELEELAHPASAFPFVALEHTVVETGVELGIMWGGERSLSGRELLSDRFKVGFTHLTHGSIAL
jgi:hypothetical protein